MRDELDRRIAAIAAGQHGLVTRDQVERADATDGWIDKRVRDGRWQCVHRGVYRIAGAPRTFRQDALAACLAACDDAMASHATAARLWRFHDVGIAIGLATGLPEIVVPRGKRSVITGVKVHEARDLEPADRTSVEGVPTTSLIRTLVDIGPRLTGDTLERLLDELLRRRLVTISRIEWRLARLGLRGTTALRRLVGERKAGLKPRDTDLEKLFSDIVDAAGLPEPVAQYHVRHRGRVLGRVDFAYPEVRVAVELDGGQHLELRRRREDVRRQTRVQSRDWLVQRFARGDMKRQPEEVAANLARTLTARALALNHRVPRTR